MGPKIVERLNIHDPTKADQETLNAAELGLDEETPWPLVFTPAEIWSPLVISFPHVGLEWPADEPRPRPAVDFARNADLDVDRLYPDAAALGAATVRARYTRLLVDLNRAPDDVSAALVPDHPAPRPRQPPWAGAAGLGGRHTPVHNRGLIWRTAVGNVQIFAGTLPYAELQHRLRRYYDPYHRAIEVLLARRCARFGHAVLLEAHSMPSSVPGDLVLGTFEGGACSPELADAALAALSSNDPDAPDCDLAVRLNDPYRGGELVRKFGRPELGVHALQLEVNRALYMDEASLRLRPELTPAGPSEIRPNAARTSASATRAAALPAKPPTARSAAAAPLALLYRVKSLVAALAAVPPSSSTAKSAPGAPAPPPAPL